MQETGGVIRSVRGEGHNQSHSVTFCTIEYKTMGKALANQMSPLLRVILAIEFNGETHNDEHASDRPYMQKVATYNICKISCDFVQ